MCRSLNPFQQVSRSVPGIYDNNRPMPARLLLLFTALIYTSCRLLISGRVYNTNLTFL